MEHRAIILTFFFRRLTPLLLLACLAAGPAHAACTNPAGSERALMYNGDYRTYQFCNGTRWVIAGQIMAATPLAM